MKNIRKFVLVFLAFSLCFTLFACGGAKCENHFDTTGDGLCELCGKEAEYKMPEAKDLALIVDGEALFQIVVEKDIDSNARLTLNRIVSSLDDMGIKTKIVEDEEGNEMDVEILVGQVKSRGAAYEYDVHKLGMEGKAITIIGNKLIVAGGSVTQLRDVVRELLEEVFGITRGSDDITDLTVLVDDCYEDIQDDYDITSIKIADNDIKDYTISVPAGESYALTAATTLQTALYSKAGIWLDIEENSTKEKLVIFKLTTDAGNDGFRVKISGDDLIYECAYANSFPSATESFAAQKITRAEGEVVWSGTVFTKDVAHVYYTDFGAAGNGTTNDIDAIRAAHVFANEGGQTVVAVNPADRKNTFYIGATGGRTVEIKTDVDWTGATIIVDDTSFEYTKDFEKTASIFTVVRDYETVTHSADNPTALYEQLKNGFSRNIDKLDYATGYKTMYVIYNSNRTMYIRNGGASNNVGQAQHELIVVDENGNIDPLTKCLFDYESVTSIVEYRIDDKPITLKGGTFKTIANAAPNLSTYYERNIMVKRSNVTIDGLVHVIENEGTQGSPYHGFLSFREMSNALIKNANLQGHKVYKNGNSNMGTYDISCHLSNATYFLDCTQNNFYKPDAPTTPMPNSMAWGIMGSNFSKNVTFDHCKLSRLDAHAGVYNASIINGSEVTYVRLIGGGTFLVKDSQINAGNTEEKVAISLRSDYGSTWNGDIILENCTIKSGTAKLTLIGATYNYDRYFGYKVYMPQNIIVDNLTIVGHDLQLQTTPLVIFEINEDADVSHDPTGDKVTVGGTEYDNTNPVEITKSIVFKNCGNTIANITVSNDTWFYENITYTVED